VEERSGLSRSWTIETRIGAEVGSGCVVDASVLVAAVVDSGADGRWSEAIVSGGGLFAPDLAIIEALNILRRLEASGQLSRLEASSAQRDLHDLDFERLPLRPFEERIWQLRHNLTCYDAWYVAAAEALELPLATLDRRLAAASGPRCPMLCPG
jgi:predicted nucleic acid-binding protein